jgi:drug/metabolite transporter (DMT)-like permease
MSQTQILAPSPSLTSLIPARYRLQILLLLGTFAGAWAAIFGRIAQHEGVSTPVIVASRMTLGALIITPFVLQHYRSELRRLNRRDLLISAAAGFWFAIHLLAGFSAMEHTSVLVSSVIGGTLTIWVALLEVYFLRVRLGRMVWIALLITLSGGLVIALNGNRSLGDNPSLGSFLALIAAVTGAAYAIIGRRSRSKISFLPYLWLVFSFGGITSLIVVFITGGSFVGHTPTGYFAVIMLIILAQLICHTIYNYVLRQLPATFVSVSSQMGMVLSAFLAYLFFNEIPGSWQLIGSLIIVAGITLVNLKKPATKTD